MTKKIKISSKNQIVIPKAMRQYAHLKSGDEIIITAASGKLILLKKPKNYAQYLAGLHKHIWEEISPKKYINDMRNKWDKRSPK